jgi:hypothetical protein
LLRARRQRPRRRRAAEQRDELPPLIIRSPRRRARQFEAERLGGRKIEDEIKFGRLLERQIAGFLATQNAIDMAGYQMSQTFS